MTPRADDRRLWLLTKGYPPDEGGLETYGRCVALAYGRLGFHVTVFTQTSAGPRRFVDAPGVEVVDVGAARQAVVFWRMRQAMRAHQVRAGRPALVHATTWRTGLLARHLSPAPYVVSAHGREVGHAGGPLGLLMRWVFGGARRVVAVSRATRDLVGRACPNVLPKTVVAWNGPSDWVSPGAATTRSHTQTPLVFTLCRLVARKNVAVAVDAAIAALNAGARFRYVIGGRGPQLEPLRAKVAASGHEGAIELLGFVADEAAIELYHHADIFLHPQIAENDGRDIEGFGIAVADAMACGSACIVGEAGGPAELIDDGWTGLVVDGRAPDRVGGALRALLADPCRTAAMGARAAAFAQAHFSWELHCQTASAGWAARGA